ncbi:hypothetical protein AB4144_21805, partial [Rhizobiaceae sp. 2RAB30]
MRPELLGALAVLGLALAGAFLLFTRGKRGFASAPEKAAHVGAQERADTTQREGVVATAENTGRLADLAGLEVSDVMVHRMKMRSVNVD